MFNTAVLEATNGGVLNINANVTQSASGHIDVGPLSRANQNGITITGGTINNTGGGAFALTNNGNNFLSGLTFNGTADLTASGQLRIVNGLTLNGAASIDNGGVVGFQGTQALIGSGSIVLGATGNNRISVDGNSTLSLGNNITLRGQNGAIGAAVFAGGTGGLINSGTIACDVSGGTINVSPSSLTNLNYLQAINGGGIGLAGGSFTNSGTVLVGNGVGNSRMTVSTALTQTSSGRINVLAGNQLTIAGGQINGGALSDAGSLVFTNNNNNILSGVQATVSSMDLSATAVARFLNGSLTLNGTGTVASGSALVFEGSQAIAGTGSIVFGVAPGNRLGIDGVATLTIGPNIIVRGQNANIGPAVITGGTGKLINNGKIAADVAAGAFALSPSSTALDSITNANTIEARNGGVINLNSNITQTAPGHVDVADAASRVNFNSITVTGGTINNPAGGQAVLSNSVNNFFDGVTVNGALNVASPGSLRIVNGLSLNGIATIDNGGVIGFQASQSLNTGTIVLGATPGNRVGIEQTSTLTLGAAAVIRGQNGTIGTPAFVAGTTRLVNGGRIGPDVAGGVFTLAPTSTAPDAILNAATLETRNGSVLNINANLTNAPGGHVDSDALGRINQNGVRITGGVINVAAGGAFVPSNNGNNFLDAVTIDGNLDLSAAAQERVDNGLTLSGAATINNGSVLAFDQTQTLFAGNLLFGTTAGNRVSIEGPGTATVTLAPGTSISGAVGTIGTPAHVSGNTQLVNNGSISANTAGGTFTLATTSAAGNSVQNNGTITATAGGALLLNSNLNYATGVLQVTDPASRLTANASLTGGALRNDGTFAHAGGSAVSVIGPIDGTGSVVVSNGRLTTTHVRQASLVATNGTLSIAAGGGTVGTSRVGSLSISGSGHVDISNHDLVLDYTGASPISSMRAMLAAGFAGGAWNGVGLTSSASGGTTRMAPGYAEATSKFTSFPATFSGQTIDDTTVIVQYTAVADANLDGKVDTLDFNSLAANFGGTNKLWTQADFNYDGVVDTIDFNFLAGNFGFTVPPEAPATAASHGGPGALVPEPQAIALPAACAGGMTRRRRATAVRSGVAG